MAGEGISEAVTGWCEIEGCSEKFMQFMIAGIKFHHPLFNFQFFFITYLTTVLTILYTAKAQ
jgi:hypothetical protein